MVINTNVSALNAQINLSVTGAALQSSIEKLSSGLRINRAADDAAGMAISENLKSSIIGTEQATRNSQDGVSMVQTADGALNEVHSILQRMRELSVQASNGDLNTQDRQAIQLELNQLTTSIDSISQNTKFNGLNLLTGNLSVTFAAGNVQVGTAVAPSLTVSNVDLSRAAVGASYTLSVCTFTSTATYAGGGITQSISIRNMTTNDAQVFNFAGAGIKFEVQTSTSALSATQILDGLVSAAGNANTGTESNFTTNGANAGGVTVQIGPDAAASNQVSINFSQIDTSTLGLTAVSVSTTTNANNLITLLDTAITAVSTQRATLGAIQNGLQDTIANLNVADENLTAANSRIRDLDVSKETVNFTKLQILNQAGTSVLAQANVLPQSALSLLR